MTEIRMSLDQLAEALGDEEEEDDGLEDDDESIVHVNDDQVADTQAMIQEMEIKEDDVDMDSGDEDAAANRASHVQIQPVKEPLPSTKKYKPPHLRPWSMVDPTYARHRPPAVSAPKPPPTASAQNIPSATSRPSGRICHALSSRCNGSRKCVRSGTGYKSHNGDEDMHVLRADAPAGNA
ncbi:hypothetical protein COCCADRAFT_27697 [Bipolaris zeicola 26-R-13]|uniref:Uncharacterized protein n=1 Tax=Cochliobolus carbonum (strain 26-R-13) TaxID=930089 RepID=W6Y0T0_COCC2|nr:uncharacterized protein COCCADRAFT_27697 [Bipolaris zeicola 26-R-13]EUC31583.1 hypothetical protein COCCADRAFT_27697 [Bipolaris zeicola 26-R-13]